MSRSVKAHILLILVTFVWGSTFVLIKSALADMTPLTFNAVRMVFAAALLGLIHFKEVKQIGRRALVSGSVVGLFLYLGYEFQTIGLQYTSAAKSAFLTGLSVVMVPVVMKAGWNKHLSRWTVAGIALSMAGLYFLAIPATEGGFAVLRRINMGDVLTLGCAVCFALQIVAVGRATARHAFGQVAFLQIASAAAFMVITAALFEKPHVTWSQPVVWGLLITGLLGTAAGFSVQAWAQQFTSPTHTALIFMLEPVFAWITAFVMGEQMGARAGLGAIMILAGVTLSEVLGSAASVNAEAKGTGADLEA